MTELRVHTVPRAEALLRSYALTKARYGRELGQRRLVFPDARDFPDPFASDAASAQRLLERMQAHAGMADIPIALRVAGADGETENSSCSSGACSPTNAPAPTDFVRVVDRGDSWDLNVPSLELKHPVLLTTGLARSLALIFLVETEQPGDPEPHPLQVELIAISLGFGGLLLQGAHVYQKACSGPRIDRFTALDVSETALLCVLMAVDSGSGLGRLPKLVEATQRAALSEAQEIVRAHSNFLRRLAEDPGRAAVAPLESEAATGFFQGLKSRFRKAEALPGDDLGAWQKALEAGPRAPARLPKPSQELIDLVKSEL